MAGYGCAHVGSSIAASVAPLSASSVVEDGADDPGAEAAAGQRTGQPAVAHLGVQLDSSTAASSPPAAGRPPAPRPRSPAPGPPRSRRDRRPWPTAPGAARCGTGTGGPAATPPSRGRTGRRRSARPPRTDPAPPRPTSAGTRLVCSAWASSCRVRAWAASLREHDLPGHLSGSASGSDVGNGDSAALGHGLRTPPRRSPGRSRQGRRPEDQFPTAP